MRLSCVFATLVVLVVMFHIPTWMLLIHHHNPKADSFISGRSSIPLPVVAENFFRGGGKTTMSLRQIGQFEEIRFPASDLTKDAQSDGQTRMSSLALVELSPEDTTKKPEECDRCTVVVQYCLECYGTFHSGAPWQIFSGGVEWYSEFGNVEVLIVTRLHRLFSVSADEDREIVQQLLQASIDPLTLSRNFDVSGTRFQIRFRLFSLQQRGSVSLRADQYRYSWDLLYRLGLRASEHKAKPSRILFIAPNFFPSRSGFANAIVAAERNASIVSCVAGRTLGLETSFTVLQDGFEVFSGNDDLPSIFPRFSGTPLTDPRIRASRNRKIFMASPLCFSSSWAVFEEYWPQQSKVEPRPSESLSDRAIFEDLHSFFRFALDAFVANISVFSSTASVIATSPTAGNARIWAAAIEALAGTIECTDMPSTSHCEEAVQRRWKRRNESVTRDVFVEWDTFCIPCFGFTNEVMHFVKPLEDHVNIRVPMNSDCFCPGTPQYFTDSLNRLTMEKPFRAKWKKGGSTFVYVSHKDPGSFLPSIPSPRPDVVVGRSMYEFNVLPSKWLAHEHDVDEIWVPSRFVRWVFQQNGFSSSRLVVIPEPVDVFFFDPASTMPLNIPFPFGQAPWRRKSNLRVLASVPATDVNTTQSSPRTVDQASAAKYFKFFSVFKWESRKGPEILLQAYFESFTSKDPVSLYIVSYIYGDNGRDPQKIMNEVKKIFESFHSKRGSAGQWPNDAPHIEVISDQIPESILAALYRSVDCFVFPTRGEGWGLPIVQAMSMGLPTIATNFSGNVDFLTSENSYLIPIEGVEAIPRGTLYGDAPGKAWAAPSTRKLGELMLHVFRNPSQAVSVGQQARRDVVSQYSEEAVAQSVLHRLSVLTSSLETKKAGVLSDKAKEKLHEFLDDKNAHLMF